MIFALVFIYTILLSYLSIRYKNSKTVYVLFIVFMWVLMVGTKSSFDLDNYRYAYDNNLNHNKEIVFELIQKLFKKAGFSFDFFKFAWNSAVSILLLTGLKKYSKNCNIVVLLFYYVGFGGFITQLRNAMAGAIIINALPLLFTTVNVDKKKISIKFSFLVILAFLFHNMSILFILLLIPFFAKGNNKVYLRKIIFLTTILLIALFIALEIVAVLLEKMIAVNFLGLQSLWKRGLSYTTPDVRPTLIGFLYNFCQHVGIAFISFNCYMIHSKQNRIQNIKHSEKWYIASYSLLLIPFYLLTMQFDRWFFIVSPVYYSMIADNIVKPRYKNVSVMYIILTVYCILIKCFPIFQNPISYISNYTLFGA